MQNRYTDYSHYLAEHFPFKVQKVSINAGLTCPNRDGSIGMGGCTYCNNQTFNPAYCKTEKSVSKQLEDGKLFFDRKYPQMKYLAYFQAYTNTYGNIEELKRIYEEALSVKDVVGLVIGTRPDCMPEALLDDLEDLNKHTFLCVEYGVESIYEVTLKRINRGHSYPTAVYAIRQTAGRGIDTGAHLILGLPGETREMILREADELSTLPIKTLKLHQLQLIRGTRMAHEYEQDPSSFHIFHADEYIELIIDFIERLRPDIVLDRFVSQSPKSLLIAPSWGLKNVEFNERVRQRLSERNTWQGKCYNF